MHYKVQCPVWEKGKYLSEENVKNWIGLESIPYLRISSFNFHSFMDAESRHKSPGSETKESLVFIAVAEARVSAFLFQCPEPSFP